MGVWHSQANQHPYMQGHLSGELWELGGSCTRQRAVQESGSGCAFAPRCSHSHSHRTALRCFWALLQQKRLADTMTDSTFPCVSLRLSQFHLVIHFNLCFTLSVSHFPILSHIVCLTLSYSVSHCAFHHQACTLLLFLSMSTPSTLHLRDLASVHT